MNRNNVLSLRTFGARVSIAEDGHVRLERAIGKLLGLSSPPQWEDVAELTAESRPFAKADPERGEFVERTEGGRFALRLLKSLVRLDRQVVEVSLKEELSQSGREQKVLQALTDAVRAVAEVHVALRDHRGKLDTQERALFAPPTIAKGDTETPFADREVRDWWRSLPSDQLRERRKSIIAGGDERVRDALLRSPIPLSAPDDTLALNAWRGAVAQREPKRVAELVLSQQSAEWAAGVAKVVAAGVEAVANYTLTKFAVYQAARSTDRGWEIFGITTEQAKIFEQRITAQSARAAAA